jgi:uncharacterized protein YcbX
MTLTQRAGTSTVIAGGTLLRLARWPVKSLGGEFLASATVDEHGVVGDRRYTVVDHERTPPRRLSAAEVPELLRWKVVGEILHGPRGGWWALDDPAASAALSAGLGRRVVLQPHKTPQQFISGSVLVTVEGSRRRLERELGQPVDLRRFRSNLHLDLDSDPFAEHGWQGLTLHVGAAGFELLHPCDRCVVAARDPDTGRKWPELLHQLARSHELLFGMFAAPLGDAPVGVALRDPVRVQECGPPHAQASTEARFAR